MSPIGAEQMRGAERRAQRLGVGTRQLMEQAGAATAATARALLLDTERDANSTVLVLAGPGNNGGDGFVAARHLARFGWRVAVVLVAADVQPASTDAGHNWKRLEQAPSVERIHVTSGREVMMLTNGLEKAALVVDALLGTGGRGALREPIRSAVDVANRGRQAIVPILAVDTPTALDLTSGTPSDPAVRAHATVTFHRPKTGLLTRIGSALAGRVLVAPIGIPWEADPA
jgi:NAD(P)H-hydrate epimerase